MYLLVILWCFKSEILKILDNGHFLKHFTLVTVLIKKRTVALSRVGFECVDCPPTQQRNENPPFQKQMYVLDISLNCI